MDSNNITTFNNIQKYYEISDVIIINLLNYILYFKIPKTFFFYELTLLYLFSKYFIICEIFII